MAWYDVFSSFYDTSLEELYRPFREAVATRLELAPGQRVLDAGCGTGQSFDVLAPAVGPTGLVVGLDLSTGMLDKARRRAETKSFANVRLVQGSLLTLDRETLGRELGEALPAGRGFDRALTFLVLSAMPEWEEVTERVWRLVEPGGLMVIADAHAETLGLQGHLVNLTARADIRRRVWSRLEALSEGFTLERLKAPASVGGDIVVAKGRRRSR
ncbi:MAG: class I SAM-dependent methyltransferase [Sandaracinus sp.]